MVFNFLKKTLQTASKRRVAQRSRRPAPFRPRLESLEGRRLMATRVWDGGADDFWTNSANWDSGAPVSGDDLVFPRTFNSTPVENLSSRNDFATDTTFNSITISSNAVISGNRITLGAGGIIAEDTSLGGDTNITFEAPLKLSPGSGPIDVRRGFNRLDNGPIGLPLPDVTGPRTDTVLTLSGAVTGSRLTKTGASGGFFAAGSGILVLSNSGTNLGGTAVQSGILRVVGSMTIGTDAIAIGGSGTTVEDGAVLELRETFGVTALVIGGTLTLNGGTLRHPSTGDSIYNGPVRLTAPSTITSSFGTLGLNSSIGNGGFLLTVDGLGDTTFGGLGVLFGAGGLTKNDSGTLILRGTGANTYSGFTSVNGGVLRLEKPSALGAATGIQSGTSVAAGAILELAGGITITGETLVYEGTTFPIRSRAGTNTWARNIHLFADTRFVADTDPLRLTGVISGEPGARLRKDGPSRLELTGNNTYPGNTNVLEGALRVNGQQPSSDVVVFGNGTLEGVGTVKGINSIEGRVSPGSGDRGVLTSLGNVAFDAGSRFVAQVVPITNVPPDKLAVTGTVTLNNAVLQVLPLFQASTTPGATFRIIDNDATDAVIGAFLNLPENATFGVPVPGPPGVFQTQVYKISYRGGDETNDVVLTYLNTGATARDLAVTPAVINEGEQVTLTGRLVDPDPRGVLTLQVNWGDGTPVQTRHPGTAPFRLTHRYHDNPAGQPNDGQYRILVTWFDQHGAGNSRDLFVTVNNMAPHFELGDPRLVRRVAMMTQNGLFTDSGADTWTATVDYGDGGGVQPLDLNTARRFHLQHRYMTPGTYTVAVAVRDDDGGVGTGSFRVTVIAGHSDGDGGDNERIRALDAVLSDNLQVTPGWKRRTK